METMCAPDLEARRRRLDELFVDEPFLSATMKASRLHEREDPSDFGFRPAPAAAAAPAPVVVQSAVARPVVAGAPEGSVARLGFVVNVRQDAAGIRAELNPEDAPDVLTPAEAARYLRVGEATLRRMVREQGLPSVHVGRTRRFRKTAILRWLRLQEGAR